tara:strand:+ start:296 stop:544 length:249 start_codon:yes stop_codon:yes gene_type:complete
MERRRDVGEGHTVYVSLLCSEHVGEANFLVFSQIEVSCSQRCGLWQAMPKHDERRHCVEVGMTSDPGRQQLIPMRLEADRQS